MTLEYIKSLTEGKLYYDIPTKDYLCSKDGCDFQVRIHDEGEGQNLSFNFDAAGGFPEDSWQKEIDIDDSFYQTFNEWREQIVEEADENMSGEVPFS